MKVVISATIRNEDTFQVFRESCGKCCPLGISYYRSHLCGGNRKKKSITIGSSLDYPKSPHLLLFYIDSHPHYPRNEGLPQLNHHKHQKTKIKSVYISFSAVTSTTSEPTYCSRRTPTNRSGLMSLQSRFPESYFVPFAPAGAFARLC